MNWPDAAKEQLLTMAKLIAWVRFQNLEWKISKDENADKNSTSLGMMVILIPLLQRLKTYEHSYR
jgi:hypothetical protein